MAADDSFDHLLNQLRQRDKEAAARLFHRFANRLLALASKNLSKRLQGKVDPEDVLQSVMKSVMLRIGDGQFDLAGWDSLLGLLTRVTINKCRKWVDYYGAQQRNLDRETAKPAREADSNCSWEVVDRNPSPEEALALEETLQELLRSLNEQEQQIVILSLQGHAVAEVAEQLECTQSKVYRVLKFIKGRLSRMAASSYGESSG